MCYGGLYKVIIIIEGIDGSGKTTLAEGLSKYYSIPIYKSFGVNREYFPEGNSYGIEDAWKKGIVDFSVADFIRQVLVNVILDRSILSCYSYGRDNDRYLVDRWWEAMPKEEVLIIFLYADDVNVLQSRAKNRKICGVDFTDLKEAQSRYFSIFSLLNGIKEKVFMIRTDNCLSDKVFELAKNKVDELLKQGEKKYD